VRVRARLVTLALLVPAVAHAQGAPSVELSDPGDGQVGTTFSVYADDDRTTVVTSVVIGRVRLPAPVIVEAHALVDAVSSASVDVVSAATTRFTENRVELGTAATARVLGNDAKLGYTTSGENDWRSHAIELGLARDVANKNTRLSLGYGFTYNRVGRAHDPTFEKRLDVQGVQLAVAQVLGKRTLGTLAYTLSYLDGYQGSPYRFIMTAGGVSAPETPPEQRTRHALTARLLHAFGGATTVDGSYRIYTDDWGVRSHTAELAMTRDLNATHELELRLRARGYLQRHAAFYREDYATPMVYMTVDRELSTFWDASTGGRLGWYGERWDLDAKVDGIYYRFEDCARLAGRVALVTGLGVNWRW
jgi:hypothetical protein